MKSRKKKKTESHCFLTPMQTGIKRRLLNPLDFCPYVRLPSFVGDVKVGGSRNTTLMTYTIHGQPFENCGPHEIRQIKRRTVLLKIFKIILRLKYLSHFSLQETVRINICLRNRDFSLSSLIYSFTIPDIKDKIYFFSREK